MEQYLKKNSSGKVKTGANNKSLIMVEIQDQKAPEENMVTIHQNTS